MFTALTALIVVGVAAVLTGAVVREHRDPRFHPDWAVWVPVTLGIGLGLLGLASLALLAQRLPPKPLVPAGPLPRPIADGTERALLRGEPLTPAQVSSLPDLVDRYVTRRQVWIYVTGPLYLVAGGVGLAFGRDGASSVGYLVIGTIWSAAGVAALHRRRRVLECAAAYGACSASPPLP